LPKEIHAAKILEENGHTVFFTPENKSRKMKNYDAIIDGRLGEFKNPESFARIRTRLNDAEKQRVSIVCLEPPANNHTLAEAESIVYKWFEHNKARLKFVDTVLLLWEGKVRTIKK
jgi:hypothetical protein